MEIFQTIWMALTTPNEGLINILSIPLTFIEISVFMLLFTSVLNIQHTKKQSILYIILTATWSIFSSLILPKEYSVFINLLVLPLSILLIFKTSILKSILSLVVISGIMALLDTIIAKICLILFQYPIEQALIIPIYRISIALLMYLMVYFIYILSKKFSFNLNLFDNINKKSKITLIIIFILGCMAIATQFYLIGYYNETLPFFITVLSLVTLLAYFFTSMYSLTQTTQLQITEQNLEEAQLYNKSLKILHDNVRAFKHDFSNIVQAIGGYIGTNDMEGLKTYYSQLLDDCQKVNNLYTLSPDVINNPAIYSLLTSKYHKADELGIKINLEVFLNLNELNMKIYEFTRALGILMDNAIEAASECDEKIINVEIRKDFKVNRQLLIIENTYKEKDVDLDKIYEKGYSSKPNNTGLGLWEVRQIMKKNNNLNLYTTKNDKFFSQQLEIYTK